GGARGPALRPPRPPAHGGRVRASQGALSGRSLFPLARGHGEAPLRRRRIQILRAPPAPPRRGVALSGLPPPRAGGQPVGGGPRRDAVVPATACGLSLSVSRRRPETPDTPPAPLR